MWHIIWYLVLRTFPQRGHEYDVPPMCFSTWFCRFDFTDFFTPQALHDQAPPCASTQRSTRESIFSPSLKWKAYSFSFSDALVLSLRFNLSFGIFFGVFLCWRGLLLPDLEIPPGLSQTCVWMPCFLKKLSTCMSHLYQTNWFEIVDYLHL